jgi:hypothetical protein
VVGVDGRIRLTDQLVVDGSALASGTVFEEGGEVRIAPAASASIGYSDERYSAGTYSQLVGPDFRAENGFITSADFVGGGSWAGVTIRPGWDWLPRTTFTPVNVWYGWTTAGELRHFGLMPNVSMRFGNRAWAWFGVKQAGETFSGKWLPSQRLMFDVGGAWTKWLELSVGGSTGVDPWYDPDAPSTGLRHQVWAAALCSHTLWWR